MAAHRKFASMRIEARKGIPMTDSMHQTLGAEATEPARSARPETSASKVVFVPADSGEAYWVLGGLLTFLVTGTESGGSYFTMIADLGPEQGPPPHIHHLEDVQIYVMDGQLTFTVGDQTFQLNTGDFIHIPRGTANSFRNGATPSRVLATFAPAGIEGFFRAVGDRVDDRTASPPAVTEAYIGRFLATEAAGWKEHHDTLPPPELEA